MNFSAPAASWPLSVAPPAAQRGRCYQIGKDLFGLSAPGSAVLPSGVDEKSMSFAAVITTIDQDRVGDVVVPAGVRLDNFARSPGVFFGHQQLPLPIGRAMSPDGVLQVQVEPERILSRCYMVQRGRWADTAADIFHLILEGALNGVSIGFNPVGPVKRLEAGGCQFDHWDLLEWSVVGVAANPQCQVIRSYLSRGRITGKRIDPLLVKGLESLAEPVRVWCPGSRLEAAAIKGNSKGDPLMSKKWGKVRQRRKASKLAEGTGTAGGYAVPPETAEDGDLHKRLRSAILLVAERHKEADPDASYHYSPASVRACHVHGATVPMEVKATVKADLEGIDGLKGVLQGALPEEEGWEKLFPVAEHTLEQNPIPPQERRAPVAQRKQELPAAALPVGDEVDDEPDGDADDDPNLPLGAQCLAALLEHLAEKTPLLEQPDIRAFYEQLLVDARDLALEVYPDLDLGLESQEEAEEEPEETPAELAPEASSPYRSYRPERLKRLSKRAASVIREAADHLSDLCELEHGASWTRTHKAACRMHHRALDGLHRELGGESSEEGPVDEKAIVQQALQEALGPLQETIYQLTGKAAPQAHTPQARTSQAHAG